MSFPQKVIASGMSLVLAFGLSPLGQVPAYAAQEGGDPAALQAQDLPTGYKGQFGEVWYTVATGSTVKDFKAGQETATKDNSPVYDGTTDRAVTFDVYDSSELPITDATQYTVTLTHPDGKTKQTSDYTIGEAGVYTIDIAGAKDYNHKTAQLKFEVLQYDISGLVFAPTTPSMAFTGKDRAVEYRIADPDADASEYYTKDDIEKANRTASGAAKITLSDTDEAALDVKYRIIHDAGSYDDATVTGTGNLKGTAAAPFDVARVELLGSAAKDAYSTTAILDSVDDDVPSTHEGEIQVTTANTGNGTADVLVSAGKVNDPIELKYYIAGTSTGIKTASAEYVTLEQGADYSVTYYEAQTVSNVTSRSTKKITGSLPSEKGDVYYAVVKLSMNSQNFRYIPDSKNEIEVKCTVTDGGNISEVAKTGTLASGTYLGGASAAADPKAGGKFYAADGTDVTDLIGTNFKPLDTFKVAASNTSKTAAITEVNTSTHVGYPTGAGTYTGTVTGDEKYATSQSQTVDVTYVVEPRAAKVGTAKGDLKITVSPGAYNGGGYVDMVENTNVKVEMYTTDTGKTTVVPPTYSSALDSSDTTAYRNWTVKYYKGDERVSKPSEAGAYTAVFTFDGNLAGTPEITQDFTVGKGDITTLVAGLRDKYEKNEHAAVTTTVNGESVTTPAYTTYDSEPSLVFTGDALPLDKGDLVLVDEDGKEVDEDKLVGTDYELSYRAGGSGASLDADGKPLTSGVYAVTATFSGNYEGTVESVLTVDKLSLRNLTDAATAEQKARRNAELQFLQDDGTTWDTAYSTVATGSEIKPTVRVVVRNGDPEKGEPTAVNESAYTATFSDNAKAGQASVALTTTSDSVLASAAAQAQAFTIADKSLAGASVELTDKDGKAVTGIKYGDANWKKDSQNNYVNVKVNLNNAPLVYNEGGSILYKANVKLSSITLSGLFFDKAAPGASGALYYKSAEGVYGTAETNRGAKADAVNSTTVGYYYWDAATGEPNGDGKYKVQALVVTAAKDGSTDAQTRPVDLYVESTDSPTSGKTTGAPLTTAPQYERIEGATLSDDAAASGNENLDGKFAATTLGSVIFKGVTLYANPAATSVKYYETAALAAAQVDDTDISTAAAYNHITASTKSTVDSDGTTAADPELVGPTTNYSVRILGPNGDDVTDKFTVDSKAAPYTAVAISGKGSGGDSNYQYGFGSAPAGEYQVVVGAGTAGTYAGRVAATFEVEKMNIADAAKARILYNVVTKATTGTTTDSYTLSDEWSIDYDAAAAGKVAGIVLAAKNATKAGGASKYFQLTYDGVAGNLVEGTDFEVSYEDNKLAGTAKVIFEGKGNYTGKVEQPYTIKRAKLEAPGTNKSGFRVDWLESPTFKWDKNAADGEGAYVADYTGSDIKPSFEVNMYENSDKMDAGDPKGMLDEGTYSIQWENVKDVSYRYNSSTVYAYAKVKITATGNYEGSIEGRFQINPTDLYDNSAVTVSPVSDQVWTGSQVIPAVNVTLNGTALAQGKDYVVTLAAGDNGTDEGEHTALIASAGQGNTTVSTPIEVKYNIKKASEITYDLTGATVALSGTQFTYNGKAQAPTVTGVTLKDGTLLDAALYTATIPSAKDANTYTVSVKGATANVTGTATAAFTIAKAANTLKVAKATRTAKGVSKAKKAVKGLKVKNAGQGTITYKKVSVNKNAKKFKVNAKTGKVTVKKGTKKGTYKVTVKATAKGNSNYASASKQAVVTVKVKK